MINAISILESEELISWPTLLVGWKERLIERTDIIRSAVMWLSAHESETCQSIILLASAEEDSNSNLESYLTEAVRLKSDFNSDDKNAYTYEKDKWRLAYLILLQAEDLSYDSKYEKLQTLYVQFGFPDDMQACSGYEPMDPIEAMDLVIDNLKRQFAFRK